MFLDVFSCLNICAPSVAPALAANLQPDEILLLELYRRNVFCITVLRFPVKKDPDVIKDILTRIVTVCADFSAGLPITMVAS